MVSSDVLGYPPDGGLRRWLTQYWIAIFGATDIGNNDFPTLEDFLRNNADRTYKDAKRLLFSFAPLEIRADLKDASDEEERFEAHEEEYLAEELSKSEIGVHALDKIRRQKEEIESLKSQVATEKKRPKRKPAEKREPKQEPLVDLTVRTPALTPQPPAPKQEIPLSMQFGEDFDRIREMIREDGAKNLEDAKRLIADRNTGLTEADRFELAELLSIAEQGIKPSKEPERIHGPAKTKGTISTTFDRTRKEREKELLEESEDEGTQKVPLPRNIPELALALKPQYSKIIVMGLRNFQEEPSTSKYMPRLDSARLTKLAGEIRNYYLDVQSSTITEWIAIELINQIGYIIFAGGYDWAIRREEKVLAALISQAKGTNPLLPNEAQISRDVRVALLTLKP